MKAAVRTVAARTNRPDDEVAFAMFELPLGAVRSHINARHPVPSTASDRVRRIASRLLFD